MQEIDQSLLKSVPTQDCWHHFDVQNLLPDSIIHNPSINPVTSVALSKYSISWDGSSFCDPGEFVYGCEGCEDYQVQLDLSDQYLRIATSNQSLGSFVLVLTAETTKGLRADDQVLTVHVVESAREAKSQFVSTVSQNFDHSAWNLLGRQLAVSDGWCPYNTWVPILNPTYAINWLNCKVSTTCSKKLYMMDSTYGYPTDPDCAAAKVYNMYLTSYSFSGSYSYTSGPPYQSDTINFTCGVASGITYWDVRFSNDCYWGSSPTVILFYYGTIALNCANCQLTAVAPSATNTVASGGTITYVLNSAASVTTVLYIKTPVSCSVKLDQTSSILIVGGVGTKLWKQSFLTDGTTMTIIISSISAADVGTYVLSLYSTVTQGSFTYSDTYVLNVIVVDPCATPVWNTNSIADITATVLQSPASSTVFTASSITLGSCGAVTYTLSPTSYSFVTFVAATRTITVNPTSSVDINTYPMTIVASLTSYPSSATQTLNFNIIVSACVVTSMAVASNPFNAALTSTVNIEDPTGLTIPIATFTQSPACGYASVTNLLADTVPPSTPAAQSWLIMFDSANIQVQSNDLALTLLTFQVQQQTTIGTVSNTQTTKVIFQSCQSAPWSPNSLSSMTTSVLVQPVLSPQTFSASSVTFALPCGPVSYVLSPALTFVTLDSTLLTVTVESVSSTDVGIHYLTLIAQLDLYPLNTQSIPFTVTINACIVTSTSVAANEFDPIATTLVYVRDTVGLLLPVATFTQTPACGYPSTNSLLADQIPSTGFVSQPFLNFINSTTIQVQTNDTTLVKKNFTIQQQTVIGLFSSFQTTIVQFVSCKDTTWIANSVNDMTTEVLAQPQLAPLIFNQSKITAPSTVDCGPISYSLDQVLSFATVDSESRKISLLPTNQNEVGDYLVYLVAKLDAYPSVSQRMPFYIHIQPQLLTANISVAYPPFFSPMIKTVFEIYVGDAWQYVLPEWVDPQDSDVTLIVDLDNAAIFTTFAEGKLSILQAATTHTGSYKLSAILTNTFGKKNIYQILLEIVDKMPLNNQTNNSTVLQQKYELSQDQLVAIQNATLEQNKTMQQLLSAQNLNSFNWADQFAAALLRGNKLAAKPIPDVQIQSVSNTGLVKLKFSQQMINPPLDLIRNATALDPNSKSELPALLVTIKKGFYSSTLNLSMMYNITQYQTKMLELQILFTTPLDVSSLADPDSVQIQFLGNQFFFDKFGTPIVQGKTLLAKLPKQVDQGTAATIVTATAVMQQTTNSIMAGNLALNIILSASLQQLWSMINTQQIIVLMPLFNIDMPANAQMFYGFIMQLASFNILPMQDYYEKFIPAPSWDEPLNERFNILGFQSTFFLNNMGTMVLGLAMIPILGLVLLILKPLTKCSQKVLKMYQKIHVNLFWSHQIVFLNESFSMVCMCALINARRITFDSQCEVINSTLTIAFIITCSLMPIIVSVFLLVKLPQLNRPDMKIKFGDLTEGLDLTKGRPIVITPANFLVRRLLLVSGVVFTQQLIVQIFIVLGGVLASLVSSGFCDSFAETSQKYNDFFNEIVIVLTLYTVMCFTGFVPQSLLQFNVGYVSCALVVGHLLINLSIMILGSAKKVILKLKRVFYQRKLKRQQFEKIKPVSVTHDQVQQQSSQGKKQTIIQRQASMTEHINEIFEAQNKYERNTDHRLIEIDEHVNLPNLEATTELRKQLNNSGETLGSQSYLETSQIRLKRRSANQNNNKEINQVPAGPIIKLKRRYAQPAEAIVELVSDQIVEDDLIKKLDQLFPGKRKPFETTTETPDRVEQNFESQKLKQMFYK